MNEKIALITGGASGIGKAITLEFAKHKINPVIFDIQDGTELVKDIEKTGIKALYRKVDVSDYGEVNRAIKQIKNDFGKINILINNAGITRDNLLIRLSEEDWNNVIDVNLKGAFNCTKAVVRDMMKARWGRIISISSIIGIMGNAGQSNYAASKAGIIGFIKSVAREVASRNITVNAIAPGFIETEMTKKLPDEVKNDYLSKIPAGKFGKAIDIANLVIFLASEQSSYITGQVIQIDGGLLT